MDKIKTNAKINITLDVVSKRADGYHNLKMIMQSVNLYDVISFEENKSGEIRLSSDSFYVPDNDKNIVVRAVRLFEEVSGIKTGGFNINIKKNIPVCAGLAGGSSNAAGTLKYLNNRFKKPLSEKELSKAALALGADVPFCLAGGTCLAEGIGEKLTRLPAFPECHIVIARPENRGISTSRLFGMIKLEEIKEHPDTEGVISAIKKGDLKAAVSGMCNVLTPYAEKTDPKISEYIALFYKCGCLGAVMSGSGNSCFGVFEGYYKAKKCLAEFKKITRQAYMVKGE